MDMIERYGVRSEMPRGFCVVERTTGIVASFPLSLQIRGEGYDSRAALLLRARAQAAAFAACENDR